MSNKTAAELRSEAERHDRNAEESFERCDTDGFLSQWASGLTASKKRLQADIEDNGGLAEFLTLFDLDGRWVPCKMIRTQYGTRWALLDPVTGKFTGEFRACVPKRRSTTGRSWLPGSSSAGS